MLFRSLAAFAGAVNASALDFDDGHYRGGAIHPSSVIVSSLLVAQQDVDGVDWQRFCVAQVVGYEIALRAAHLLWPKHPLDDYHCTGTAATLGAAAAIAKLRGDDADCISRSISIAWAHAPMSTFQLPMVKESIGWSAASALGAADLARAGFMRHAPGRTPTRSPLAETFPPTPFHRHGALDDPFVASLGSDFETDQIYFKAYATCRYTHTALRSLQQLMTAHGFGADEVDRIDVFTPRPSMRLSDPRPSSLDHAQYSFPFVLASMLCCGAAGAEEICESALDDPTRLAAAHNVTVRHDAALDPTYPARYATRLVVSTSRGSFEMTRLVAPGDPDEPMAEVELVAKFATLTRSVGGGEASSVAEHFTAQDSPDLDALVALVLDH